MSKGRLEAFSDGVFAVLITIMVLELKVPHGDDWSALRPLIPVFLTYVLSFIFLGIYWIAIALYVAVALIWVVPDRRIESTFTR